MCCLRRNLRTSAKRKKVPAYDCIEKITCFVKKRREKEPARWGIINGTVRNRWKVFDIGVATVTKRMVWQREDRPLNAPNKFTYNIHDLDFDYSLIRMSLSIEYVFSLFFLSFFSFFNIRRRYNVAKYLGTMEVRIWNDMARHFIFMRSVISLEMEAVTSVLPGTE